MNAPAQKWTGRLVDAVLADSGDAIMHERLDALVRWLAGVKGPESESITLEFEKRDTSERQAQQLALVAIDPILFDGRDNPWTTLGLAPGTDPEAIKQRYYRLTKIYHPDRQLSAEEWLNERAEKINRAYEQVKRGRAPASAEVGPRTGFEPTFAHSRPGHGRTIAIDRREAQPGFGRWARELLGGAHRLQRNTIITAASIAAVVLTLFALQDDDPYIPRTSTNTQTTEPEPTPRRVGFSPRVQFPETNAPTQAPEPSTTPVPQPQFTTSLTPSPQPQSEEAPQSKPRIPESQIAENRPKKEIDSTVAERITAQAGHAPNANSTTTELPSQAEQPAPTVSRQPAPTVVVTVPEPDPPRIPVTAATPEPPPVAANPEPPVPEPEPEPIAGEPEIAAASPPVVAPNPEAPAPEPFALPEPATTVEVEPATTTEQPEISTSEPEPVPEPEATVVAEARSAPDQPNAAEPNPVPAVTKPERVVQVTLRDAPVLPTPTNRIAAAARETGNAQSPNAAPKAAANDPQKDAERLRQKARFFLAQYANLYTEGNADALAGLYEEDARQEKLDNRGDIRGHYERFFRLTESRELYFQLQDVEPQQQQYRVTAGYTVRLTYKGGRGEQLSGNASFKLNQHGNTLAIQEAAY